MAGDIEVLTSEAMKQTRLLPNNPREVSLEDATRLCVGRRLLTLKEEALLTSMDCDTGERTLIWACRAVKSSADLDSVLTSRIIDLICTVRQNAGPMPPCHAVTLSGMRTGGWKRGIFLMLRWIY